MKRWLQVGVAVLAVAGVATGAPVPTAGAEQAMRNVPRITIDEVKKLMAAKQVVLIDVRDPMSFAEGHMPGAINVPFDHLPNHVDAWKKEKRLLVTYCA
jgi:3-mercaptopyruvate sulfurtransferase SseA